MTESKIKISFILPCYNVQDYIKECLNSLVKIQDFLHCQIICVNDGSKDSTLEILRSYENILNNFCIIDQTNQGLSEARNVGISYAVGEWICFVDSDDILDPDGFKELKKYCEFSNAQVICSEYSNLFDKTIERVKSPIPEMKEISGVDFLNHYYFSNPLSMVWRYLFKRDYLLDAHLKFMGNIYFEDMEFTPRALLKAQKVEYLKICTYLYRQRGSSIMSSNFSSKKFIDSLKVALSNLKLITEEPSINKAMKKSARYTLLRAISLFKPSGKELLSDDYYNLERIAKQVHDKILYTILILYKHIPNMIYLLFKGVRNLKSIR